jgi:biliverdin reductase
MEVENVKLGIIGAGRAGRARMRAIKERPDLELSGIASTQDDVRTHTMEDLIASDVDGILVCTINSAHASQVSAALAAGKHVLCEYPLALSHDDAVGLFDQAEREGKVLHVEHIELLSGSQMALRKAAQGLGRPVEGVYHTEANSEGWIADMRLAGFPSFSGISRLSRLVDLFGPAGVEGARFEENEEEQRLIADLKFVHGGRCRLDYRRGRGLPRREDWDVRCERGDLRTPAPLPTDPLFASDLDVFVRRVRDGAEGYVANEQVLDVMSLAEEIQERCEARR